MSEREPLQGVDITQADNVSKLMFEAAKLSYENRRGLVEVFHPTFSGLRGIPLSFLKDPEDCYTNLDSDGVGTKIEVSERLDDHSTVAFDLFAMICDDIVIRGAEPVAVSTVLDVKDFGDPNDPESLIHAEKALEQLAKGYAEAAKEAGVIITGGESAPLGDRVGGYSGLEHNFNYNWSGSAIWFAHKSRILSGHEIQPGNALIGLEEKGFRSNGLKETRKAMLEQYGDNWHNLTFRRLGALPLGKLVQRPSTIYTRLITDLTAGYDIEREPKAKITGAAHITGGGMPGKLSRMLEPSGLGVEITDPFKPSEIMLEVQSLRNFSDETAYRTWCMGTGMILAAPESEAEKIITVAKDHKKVAKIIGHVTSEPAIRINSMAANHDQLRY